MWRLWGVSGWRGDWLLAILFGSLTLVTGPTVIVPMLRVVRPKASIANILRWEGIVIDPIDALLAVVVYSFIIARTPGDGLSQGLLTFGGVILCGTAFGIAGDWVLGTIIRRQWLPEYLHNLAALAAVSGFRHDFGHQRLPSATAWSRQWSGKPPHRQAPRQP